MGEKCTKRRTYRFGSGSSIGRARNTGAQLDGTCRIGSVNRFCAAFCFARLYIGPSVGSGRSCAESLWTINDNVRLKWPNDLWIGNGKVAGILCELVRNRAYRLHAVVGIGVNMCLGDKGVPTTDVPAMALLAQLPDARQLEVLRVRTAAGLGASIERVCNRYSRSMVKGLQERWSQLDAWQTTVELTLPSGNSSRADGGHK